MRKIDVEYGKITLTHEATKSLAMPGMTMVFQIDDKTLSEGLASGDNVQFQANKIGTKPVVTAIEKNIQGILRRAKMRVITRSPRVISDAVFTAALLVIAALLALITPTQGWAHTSLTTSAPENGQTVTSVSQLNLEFGAPLRLMRVSLKNAAGQEVALNFKRSATAQARFVVPTNAPLAPASYQVFWMGMTDDGHKIEGDFGFIVNSIAVAVTAEPATATAMAMFSGLEHPATPTVLAFHAALKAGERQAVVRLLASDVVIFEGGGVERSRDEYQSHPMASAMAYLQHMSTTTIGHHVKVQGDSAVSLARTLVVGQFKEKIVAHTGMETIT